MTTSITLQELIDSGKPQLARIEELARQYPDASSSQTCEVFSKQVRLVEGLVTHLYGVVASTSRKTQDLSEIADMWSMTGYFCNMALEVLRSLKGKYEYCGTAELYDLALDYKLACDKRYKGVLEEISCQKMDLPSQLFPQVN